MGVVEIEHIGSARDHAQLAVLIEIARQVAGCVFPPVRREALVDRVEVRDLDRGSVAAGLRS